MDAFLLQMQEVQGFSDKEEAVVQDIHSMHVYIKLYVIEVTQYRH